MSLQGPENYIIRTWYYLDHSNIPENEKINKEAKNATNSNDTPFLNISTYLNTINKIKKLIKLNDKTTGKKKQNSKFQEIKNNIFQRHNSNLQKRKKSILTRLFIGHTNIIHMYLIGKPISPICNCGTNISIKHILSECRRYIHDLTLWTYPLTWMQLSDLIQIPRKKSLIFFKMQISYNEI